MAKHFTVHYPVHADKIYVKGEKIAASKLNVADTKALLGSGHITAIGAEEESAPKPAAPTEDDLQKLTKGELVDLAKKKLKLTLNDKLTKDEMISAIIAAFEADDADADKE